MYADTHIPGTLGQNSCLSESYPDQICVVIYSYIHQITCIKNLVRLYQACDIF